MSNVAIVKYPFTALESARNPLPLWQRVLDDGPITRTRLLFFNKVWLATTWEAANEVLRDQEHFGRDASRVGKTLTAGLQWWMPRSLTSLANNMLAYDKEKHRRLRSIADQAFLRSQIEELRPRIEAIADQVLDEFENKLAASKDGSADILDTVCRQLPLAVICEVLGLPQEDRPKFTNWFRGFSEFSSLMSLFKIVPSLFKTIRYFEQQFADIRTQPRPGLLNELVQSESNGERLTEDELVAMAFILLVAGHETTVHLISNGVLMLLQNPEQRMLLEQDWEKVGLAVDEILRLGFLVQMSKPRYVIQDLEFHGVPLKRGELICACLASANIDPAKFAEPERFDVLRRPNPHMTFGSGVHVCLGMQLARTEGAIALQKIFSRFPSLKLADESVDWGKRLGMRTLRTLRLRLS